MCIPTEELAVLSVYSPVCTLMVSVQLQEGILPCTEFHLHIPIHWQIFKTSVEIETLNETESECRCVMEVFLLLVLHWFCVVCGAVAAYSWRLFNFFEFWMFYCILSHSGVSGPQTSLKHWKGNNMQTYMCQDKSCTERFQVDHKVLGHCTVVTGGNCD